MDPLQAFRLDGRVVIVTGATSGLGVGFAHAITAAGGHVVLAGRRGDRLTDVAREIEARGGTIRRVVLDYELKKEVYSKLARERDAGALEYSRRQREIADEQGLPVVDGKIALPDLRIEYEGRDGDMARVDLELATEHYRGSNLAEKVRAGFSLYARAQDAPGLRRVLDQKELTAEILSL